MNKRQVDEFMELKSVQQATQNILPGGSRLDTTSAVTVPCTVLCEKDENTAKQDVWAQLPSQHITLSYETDEEEFC
jgi:hypothetical protein